MLYACKCQGIYIITRTNLILKTENLEKYEQKTLQVLLLYFLLLLLSFLLILYFTDVSCLLSMLAFSLNVFFFFFFFYFF